VGNPCRSAVEGNALNCGLMLTCGAAHRVAVNDGLASFTISCCQKKCWSAPPKGCASTPRVCVGFAVTSCWSGRRGTCHTSCSSAGYPADAGVARALTCSRRLR